MRFRKSTIQLHIPNWPEGTRFRALLLADLHDNRLPGLVEEVRAIAPDAIFFAGDAVKMTRGAKKADWREAAKTLLILAELCPVYWSEGNHDLRFRQDAAQREAYEAFREALEAGGVRFLDNEEVRLPVEGTSGRKNGGTTPGKEAAVTASDKREAGGTAPDTLKAGETALDKEAPHIDLWGLSLPKSAYRRHGQFSAEEMRNLLGTRRKAAGELTVLLAHHPNYLPAYAAWGADLVLAGHVHGGVIRLPGIGGLVGPGLTLFPPYSRGLYREGSTRMVVTAGLGMHTVPLRLCNPREIAILELIGENHGTFPEAGEF